MEGGMGMMGMGACMGGGGMPQMPGSCGMGGGMHGNMGMGMGPCMGPGMGVVPGMGPCMAAGPSMAPCMAGGMGMGIGVGDLPRDEVIRRCEAQIQEYQLDERARQVAHEVPPEALLDIFSQLAQSRNEIRNPSAFIFQGCVNFQKQNPNMSAGRENTTARDPEYVEDAIVRLELDATASCAIRALSPSDATGILDRVTDNVNNKSAFVTTAAKRILGPGWRPETSGGGSSSRDTGGNYDAQREVPSA